jgi:prophage DNA circulation protein
MSLLAKKFRQASFRGITFKIDSTDLDAGRRVVAHEYPLRDTPNSEDMGRKRREFTIEGYVLGETYEAQRDGLIDACEESGEGVLIHPYLGTKNVICTGCRVRESKGELGIAYFSLSFIEVGLQEFPGTSVDQITKTKSTIETLQGLSSAAFEKIYTIADAPSFVTDSAESKISGFTDVVQGEASKIRGVTEKLADYTYQVRNMKADVRTIAQTPARVAENFVSTLNAFLAVLPGGSKEMKSALKGISRYGVDFDTSNVTTSSRQLEVANTNALTNLNFELVTGLLASEAADRIYSSFEDAISDRDEALEFIDAILNRTTDDDVYRGFQRLRNDLVKAVPDTNQDLPRIVTIELQAVTPSLVVAYDLYESLNLESDIVSRNGVTHPAFIPAQRDLKVLRES